MQTVEIDCAPLSGHRTMGFFFMVYLFFSLLYPYGRGGEIPGFGMDAQKMKEIV